VYDLERDFAVQLILIAMIVLASMAAALAVRKQEPWRFGLNPAATCLALGSMLAILVGTVSRRGDGRARGRIQLVPLRTLRNYQYDHSDLLIYLVGNVALFMPLGFFLYLALRRGLIASTAICALVSVSVEICNYRSGPAAATSMTC
jgi:glycopeptide antibiotics resistance protein